MPVDEPTTELKPNPPTRLENRRNFVFASGKRDGLILEIGPAHNAILPKREGFRTKTVDYLDREGLVEKYRDFSQYSADDIEDVDYVLPPGAPMADIIPESFDIVLASHVIEHTTSLVHFINDCSRLLTDDGVLCLVVPDKRYCFDRFRERSALSRVIDSSVNPPSVHSVGTLTEFMLSAVRHRDTGSWAPGHRGEYHFIHDIDRAMAKAKQAESGVYIDVHNWIFTPNHLRLLFYDLYHLGLIEVEEDFFHGTIGHEFFLNLRRGAAGTGLTREELTALADEELRTLDDPVFKS